MNIKPPQNISGVMPQDSSPPAVPVTALKLPTDWQVGKLFEVIINRMSGQQLLFELSGTPVYATKPEGLELTTGDRLVLQFIQTKNQAELKVVRHLPQLQQPSIIDTALKQLTEKQAPLADIRPLFTALSRIAMTPVNNQQGVSPVLIRQVRELFDTIASPRELAEPQSLKKQLQHSGIFTEHQLSKLATGEKHLPADLRIQLQRVAEKVRSSLEFFRPLQHNQANRTDTAVSTPVLTQTSPPLPVAQKQAIVASPDAQAAAAENKTFPEFIAEKLLENIDKTLTRQQAQQLQHAQAEQSGKTLLVLDLPVRDQQKIDLFHLQIEKDSQGHADDEAPGNQQWKVSINFDFPGFGQITARLWLHDRQLATRFEINQQSTRDAFSRELHRLEEKLSAKGFTDLQLLVTPELNPNQQLNRRYGLE